MRRVLLASVVLLGAAGIFGACAASSNDGSTGGHGGSSGAAGSDGAGGAGGGSAGAAGTGGGIGDSGLDVSKDQELTPDTGCATASFEAQQAPAAFMIVLDRSSSMAQNNKFAFAAQAIVQAIDNDAFDSMYVGALAVPQGTTNPSCLFGISVSCGVPPFPQVALTLAGTQKSTDPSGVRHDIKGGLAAIGTDSGLGDATPLYAAMQLGIISLQGWNQSGKRIMFVISDGTIDCTDGSGRAGYTDCNGCQDWENPGNIVTLLQQAHDDPQKPVDTFIVGVPGADTYDPSACNYPPYHMRLALSAMAYAGAPEYVDPSCTGTTFSQGGGDPAVSCHFDMTQGNFNVQALVDAITKIRGATLGCTYDLPSSATSDPNKVNVETGSGDGGLATLSKRSDPNDTCATDGCWDYDPNDPTKIDLIGKACDDAKTSSDEHVQIVVGCQTHVK
jgi:hypothetical protein